MIGPSIETIKTTPFSVIVPLATVKIWQNWDSGIFHNFSKQVYRPLVVEYFIGGYHVTET